MVESPDTLYLLTEVMSGGELFDTLQGTKTFSEQARGCPHLSSWTSDFARAAPPHAPAAAQRQRHTASPNISYASVQVCRMVTVQLASALAHLHLRHFTAHCDLKPANILCRRHRPRLRLRPRPRPVLIIHRRASVAHLPVLSSLRDTNVESPGCVKLADFGFAQRFKKRTDAVRW